MPAPYLSTFQDAVDLAVDYRNAAADERNQRRIRAAIQAAYRDLSQARNWRYLYAIARIQGEGYYDTGTVVYDHTGGSSERMVTITTGTWPSWANNGTLRIGSVNHRVASRVSSSIITLDSVNCPAADISSTSDWTLYQSLYNLPYDFRALASPETETSFLGLEYVPPEEWLRLERHQTQSGIPRKFTVLGSVDTYGNKQIGLWPYLDSDQTLDFVYQRYARQLRYSGYETNSKIGTVACSASTTVTGTSTQFTSAMIGSIIRFSTSTTLPDGEGGLNPWAEQKVIADVASTTSLTLDSATTGTYSGVAYTISDPIDLAPTMIDAFRWRVLKELDALNRGDAYKLSSQRFAEAYMVACECDSDVLITRVAEGPYMRGIADYNVDLTTITENMV